MNRIVHLALKVEDLEATTRFYPEVFGFREVETKKVRDHTSRHLTDGHIDFALLQYDPERDSKEKNAADFSRSIEAIEKQLRPQLEQAGVKLAR